MQLNNWNNSIILTDPAGDLLAIARAAVGTLPRMIDPHARYVRAGVVLGALTSTATYQTFEGMNARKDNGIGQALDQANRKFGAMSVGIGWADKGLRTFSWRLNERILCSVKRSVVVPWSCISPLI